MPTSTRSCASLLALSIAVLGGCRLFDDPNDVELRPTVVVDEEDMSWPTDDSVPEEIFAELAVERLTCSLFATRLESLPDGPAVIAVGGFAPQRGGESFGTETVGVVSQSDDDSYDVRVFVLGAGESEPIFVTSNTLAATRGAGAPVSALVAATTDAPDEHSLIVTTASENAKLWDCAFVGMFDSAPDAVVKNCTKSVLEDDLVTRAGIEQFETSETSFVTDGFDLSDIGLAAFTTGYSGSQWIVRVSLLSDNQVFPIAVPSSTSSASHGIAHAFNALDVRSRGFPYLFVAAEEDDGTTSPRVYGINADQVAYTEVDVLASLPRTVRPETGELVLLAHMDIGTDTNSIVPEDSEYSAGWVAVDDDRLLFGRQERFGPRDTASLPAPGAESVVLVRRVIGNGSDLFIYTSRTDEAIDLHLMRWPQDLEVQRIAKVGDGWTSIDHIQGFASDDGASIGVIGTDATGERLAMVYQFAAADCAGF